MSEQQTIPHMPAYQQAPPPQAHRPPPSRKKRRARRGCTPSPSCLLGCIGFSGALLSIVLLVGLIAYYQLNRRLNEQIDDLETRFGAIDDPNSTSGFESTFIYDRNGNQVWEIFGQGRRQKIALSNIPLVVQQATISVEDDDFYSNPGFDVSSNLRAVWQFIQYRQAVSGASTITQQLVRNVVFDPEYRRERSIERKLEEIALATVLTQQKSKDEILELYLNTIYYGNLAYGIESASQIYFGKSAAELELHEAALLAGLPQLPAIIDPLNPNPDIQAAVLERQYLILDLMVEEKYITEDEATLAKSRPLNYASPEVPLEAPHFTLYAVQELEKLLLNLGKPPEFLVDGGLRVYTTVDLRFQEVAEDAARANVSQLRAAHNLTNASVVILHPPSGEILAMVGSIDYNDEAIDGQVNVSIAQRQPGSTVKPFTYAANFEIGNGAESIFWDVETPFSNPGQADYVPLNYDRRFHGPVRMRDALANSYNVPAVLALDNIGVSYLISYLERMGTKSFSNQPGRYGLSLTLGGGEITLLEMTSNYATLARSGVYVPTQAILCVVDKNDQIVYQYEGRCPRGILNEQSVNMTVRGTPVMDPRVAFIISDILADNRARSPAMGANSPLNTGALISAVKTGTTDSFRDNWTLGYTQDIVVGVWSGNSDNSPMVNISGLTGAAPIWNNVIGELYRRADFGLPPSQLNPPQGVSQRAICNLRNLSDPSNTCNTYYEWFLDSPVLIPDGQGNLVESGSGNSGAPPPAPEFGPRLVEREPNIFEVAVRPLDPSQRSILLSQNPSAYVEPKYCMVPVEVLGQVFDAQNLLFIAPPLNPNYQRNAYRYAASANIPILPQFPCTGDTILAFAPVSGDVTAQIVSPANGQTVSGVIPIYGVVNYPDGVFFDYYKIDVLGPPFPDWTTMGNIHHNEVLQPDVLETFYAEALPPGTYQLRLWLQGDLPPMTHEISINLVSP